MDDFERMRKQWERLSKDLAPSMEIIRQFQRQHDWVRIERDLMSATIAAEEHFQTLRRLGEPKYFSDLSAELAGQELNFNKLAAAALSSGQGQWTEVARAIHELKRLAGPGAFSAATEELQARSGEIGSPQSHAAATELEDEYLRDPHRLQLSPATAQFILSILVALLLFWLSQQATAESEERIIGRVAELETAIEETVRALQPDHRDTGALVSTRIVDRSTVVLSHPNGRSGRALGLVYVEQVVVVQGGRGKWCRVEWLDLRDRSLKVGWVRKKYLGRVQR